MRVKPILFSGAMVRAILDGRKMQTRRVVKGFALELLQPDKFTPDYVAMPENDLSPYGFVGDRLWVRETFFAFGRWETRFSEKKKRDEWHFVDMTLECDRAYQYAADNPDIPVTSSRHCGVLPAWWKRPAIHKPRAASRITLEVTGVRVERLQEISEKDAIAEGIERHYNGWRPYTTMFYEADGVTPANYLRDPRDSYRQLWDSLNAERGFGWNVNPWVWGVEFKRIAA